MIEFLTTLGPVWPYLVIVAFLVLTGSGLPIPEEVPIVAAGVLASGAHETFQLNVWLAFAACLVGAILGDSMVYATGRFMGKNFFRRHRWFATLLHEDREKQMESLIARHGLKVFFLARFMIGVRAPIYMAAGVMRVSWPRFLVVDCIAATVVVSIVFWLSFVYGEQISWLVREFSIVLTIVVAVAVLSGVVYYVLRKRRLANQRASSPAAESRNVSQGEDGVSRGSQDNRAKRIVA